MRTLAILVLVSLAALLGLAWLQQVALRPAAGEPGAGPFHSPAACRAWLAARSGQPAAPRIASWNIRWFPDGGSRGTHPGRSTDLDWLACAIASLQVPVVAVQEILQHRRGRAALLDLLDRLDAHTGGRWSHGLDDCPGSGRQHLGLLFDTERVRVERLRMVPQLNPGDSACDRNLRPGYGAYLRFVDGPDLHLLTLHLDSGRGVRDFRHRRVSLERLAGVVSGLSEVASDPDVVVLGDFNTMGCGACEPEVDAESERGRLGGAARRAGLRLLRPALACSHYYRGRPGGLDHVLVSRQMAELSRAPSVRVAGPCARLGCRRAPRGRAQAALRRLSDHCPLVLELAAADLD